MLNKIAKILGDQNRTRKYELFKKVFPPNKTFSILDVGASENEYQLGANIIEKKYSWPEKITALGVEKYEKFKERYPHVRTVEYDGARFPFEDNSFDLCWSNAVLEHVGDSERQVRFVREIKRVAKHAFLTTPNRFFPFELHTRYFLLHYLPKETFDQICVKTGKGWASGDYLHLLSYRALKEIIRRSGVQEYKIVRNRILGITIDFSVIF